jgi:hypothetical protein
LQAPDPLHPNPAFTHAPVAPAQPAHPAAPATPTAPVPPLATASAHVDLGKIVLPKKPGTPSLDSAQRVNAGVLFEQERTAALHVPEKPAAPETQPQAPKAEQPLVKPLQTYQSDIESLVGEKQVSVVSIAAAEAERRGMQAVSEQAVRQEGRPWLVKTLVIATSIVFLAAAGGTGYYIYMRLQPVPLAQQAPAPFITVDDTQTVVLQPDEARSAIMSALMNAKNGVSLSLGLMARLQIAKPGPLNDGTVREMGAPEFLQALAPSIPPQLVRTLEPQMLLGVHSFGDNEAFMILKADSYDTAYSGMLAWEETLYNDLMPLFKRVPPVRSLPPAAATNPAPIPATTTAAGAGTAATGAPATSTPAATTTAPAASAPQFLQGNFLDQIVENRDTRAMLNPEGDILMLWTFLDRTTIVIATNESTLREIISRLSQASLISLPAGQ